MTMVQVRKQNTRNVFTEITLSRWFFNLFIVSTIFFFGAIYLVLLSQEEAAHKGSSLRVGMASALSTKFLVHKPHLVYGTAWKKEDTPRLVSEAIHAGFRFIDTACQPKHYNEPGVGIGWSSAAAELGLQRDEVWLQTKYTSLGGQDPKNMPYPSDASIREQIETSLATSLANLKTPYLDSWVMHSPFSKMEDTLKAWKIMEEAVDAGKVRQLGMSNTYDYPTFLQIYDNARHKPAVLQNRFYADSNFDTELRAFCEEKKIHYQSFWTLTANRQALATPEAKELADQHGLTPQTLLYAFLMSLGYPTPLSGTTNQGHMAEDVAIMERMQGGEAIFKSDEEKRQFAKLLGMPAL